MAVGARAEIANANAGLVVIPAGGVAVDTMIEVSTGAMVAGVAQGYIVSVGFALVVVLAFVAIVRALRDRRQDW